MRTGATGGNVNGGCPQKRGKPRNQSHVIFVLPSADRFFCARLLTTVDGTVCGLKG